MRLLHAVDKHLQDFHGEPPNYAILSHTWRDGEVLYDDIRGGFPAPSDREKHGFAKIRACCDKATSHSIDWVWVDTCCIDKSSSSELSEAINSMFRWYQNARVCYVYLDDALSQSELPLCRWFTRGWTLQELLGPVRLLFYNSTWIRMGTRSSLDLQFCGIPSEYLQDRPESSPFRKPVAAASVAQRMSWAANRETTRLEDVAYCLMGLFDVNMPLLYGEGGKAFQRLQEEILRTSCDHSIFVWGLHKSGAGREVFEKVEELSIDRNTTSFSSTLAIHPREFANCKEIRPYPTSSHEQGIFTNRGMQIHVPLVRADRPVRNQEWAILSCYVKGFPLDALAIPVDRLAPDVLARTEGSGGYPLSVSLLSLEGPEGVMTEIAPKDGPSSAISAVLPLRMRHKRLIFSTSIGASRVYIEGNASPMKSPFCLLRKLPHEYDDWQLQMTYPAFVQQGPHRMVPYITAFGRVLAIFRSTHSRKEIHVNISHDFEPRLISNPICTYTFVDLNQEVRGRSRSPTPQSSSMEYFVVNEGTGFYRHEISLPCRVSTLTIMLYYEQDLRMMRNYRASLDFHLASH